MSKKLLAEKLELKSDQNQNLKDPSLQNLFTYVQCTKLASNEQDLNKKIIVESEYLKTSGQGKKKDQKLHYKQKINRTLNSCQFVSLKTLYLHEFYIDNIQFLVFLDAPIIQYLFLSSNKITSYHSFKKTNFPSLLLLSIQCNFMMCLSFERMNKSKRQMRLIFEHSYSDPIIMQDLTHFIKMQQKMISYLKIFGQKRIKQEKLIKKLQQRFMTVNQEDGFVRYIDIAQQISLRDL